MRKLLLAVMAVCMVASGCASLPELKDQVIQARKSGREGVSKVYPVSPDQAWDIAGAVFRWEKTDEIEEHRNENYMITSTGMKMAAFGSVMGVWIEPIDPDNTKVIVITKRRVEDDKFTSLDAETFFKRFEQGLGMVKGGRKLPVVPPAK
jgi:hypothetical protein